MEALNKPEAPYGFTKRQYGATIKTAIDVMEVEARDRSD